MTYFDAIPDNTGVGILANGRLVHVWDCVLPRGVKVTVDGQWLVLLGVGVVRFNWFADVDLLDVPEEAHNDLSYEAWWEAGRARERELTGQEIPPVVWRDTIPRFVAAARRRPYDLLVRLKRAPSKDGDALPDGWRPAFCQALNGLGLHEAAKRMARMRKASNDFEADGLSFHYYVEGEGKRRIGCLTAARHVEQRRIAVHAVSIVDDGNAHIALGAPYEARAAFSNVEEYAIIGKYGFFGAVCDAQVKKSTALKRAVDKFSKEC